MGVNFFYLRNTSLGDVNFPRLFYILTFTFYNNSVHCLSSFLAKVCGFHSCQTSTCLLQNNVISLAPWCCWVYLCLGWLRWELGLRLKVTKRRRGAVLDLLKPIQMHGTDITLSCFFVSVKYFDCTACPLLVRELNIAPYGVLFIKKTLSKIPLIASWILLLIKSVFHLGNVHI